MKRSFSILAALACILAIALPVSAAEMTAGPDFFGLLWRGMLAAAPVVVPIVNGPIVAFVTELLKRAPAVPFNGSTVTGLIAVLTAVSLATTLLCDLAIAWLSGNPAAFDVAHAGTVLAQIGASVMTAAGAFGLMKKATI